MNWNQYEMTTGDMFEYERALNNIEAMKTAARRHPWRAKALRALEHRETDKLRELSRRYEAVANG